MKRSGFSRRSKPLLSGTSLSRKARLARKPMATVRARRSPEETRARAIVSARSGGRCECCDKAEALHWAHRQARSQGGPWDAANGLHACAPCHEWAHSEPATARWFGWSVRRGHDYRNIPVWTARHGWVRLSSDGSVHPAERPNPE